MTETWSLVLPQEFNRRIEGETLVLWRPGFTIWIDVWNNDRNASARSRCDLIRATASTEAFATDEINHEQTILYSYRLNERRAENLVFALYAFVFAPDGEMNMAFYFDDESELPAARQIWLSATDAAMQ